MDLDNKILKYKLKKKKLTNKINELIEKKKKEKHDSIAKIFHKTHEFSDIINKIIMSDLNNLEDKENNNKNILIIVSGFECVGKSTFIEHLEKYFGISYTKLKVNIKDKEKLNTLDNLIMSEEKKIVYIETNPDLVEKIHKKIIDSQNEILNDKHESNYKNELYFNIHTFYIIPTNLKLYKNRLINKLFNFFNLIDSKIYDLDKNNNYTNLTNKIAIDILQYNNIQDNNLSESFIRLKDKYPISYDDFSFLDNYIEKSYNSILEYNLNNEKLIKNILKYYF